MRKREKTDPILKNWDEVDDVLRGVAEIDIITNEIVSGYELQIQELREQMKNECAPHLRYKAKLEEELKIFAEAKKDEFIKSKTRFLNFGKVGFRKSTTIKLLKKAEDVIERLKAMEMFGCINTKETINKEALRQFSEDVITTVGCKKNEKDEFWYEADREKVQEFKS